MVGMYVQHTSHQSKVADTCCRAFVLSQALCAISKPTVHIYLLPFEQASLRAHFRRSLSRLVDFDHSNLERFHYMSMEIDNKGAEDNLEMCFVQKLPGLWIATNQENERGRTSVVRQDPNNHQIYPVWDSTWSGTREILPLSNDLAKLPANGPCGILAVPSNLNQTLEVHHTMPDKQQTTI